MKQKGSIYMKKANITAIVLASTALAAAIAALAVGIIALVKSCGGKRLTAAEYNYMAPAEDEDEENIGSDTLAF